VSERSTPGHASADLVGLLNGEVGRGDTVAMGRHLRECPSCSDELVDLAVAHGALAAVARADRALDGTAPQAGPRPGNQLAGSSPGTGLTPFTPLRPLPAPERVRSSTPLRRRDNVSGRASRTRHRRLTSVAMAAVAAVAALALSFVAVGHGSGRPVVARASLRPMDHGAASAGGTVTVLADGSTRQLIVRAADLSAVSGHQYYEVWLLDPTTSKMLPVGVLPPSGRGAYSMSSGLMAGYTAVDVSLQRDDGNPAHSTTSVLRASL